MITVWGRTNSANVQKVIWLLDELGCAWNHVDAGGAAPAERQTALLEHNPNGLVPVVQDNDLVLWESNAILRHLARAQKNYDYYGVSAKQSSRIDQWLDWQQCTLWPPMMPWFLALARTPPEQRDYDDINSKHHATLRNFEILEDQLMPGNYIIGPDLTLADIALGPFIHRWFTFSDKAKDVQPRLYELYCLYKRRTPYLKRVASQPF